MSEERIRLIDELTKSKGYEIALFSTYNFDINYFERAILNKLYEKGIKKISLFVDSDEFDKSLNNLKEGVNYHLGRKYIVSPVDINGAFHPKVAVLLGKKKAKVIVASSNITTSGYERNNEVFNCIEYTEKDHEYQDIVVKAIEYFINVNDISYSLDGDLINECKDYFYYSKSKENPDRRFVCNIESSIMDNIIRYVKEDVLAIYIMVPYYDSDVSALKKIKEFFPQAKISLYIQQGTSTFPVEYEDLYDIVAFNGFKDTGNINKSFYHGKVLLFKTSSKDYIVYGSANCSNNALFKTYRNAGNIECDLLDVGEKGEFDSFFECVNIINVENIKSNAIDTDEYLSKKFKFIYAETSKDGVTCYIKALDNNIEEIKYAELSLDYKINNDMLEVYIDNNEVEKIPYIFDMNIICLNEKNTIRCWIIDKYSISINRKESNDQDFLENFEIDSDGEKYREERLKIIKAELMCVEDVQEYRKRQAIINQQKLMDEEDDESDDAFIVDSEMHYEYKSKLRKYESLARIRGLYLHYFLYPSEYKEAKKNGEKDDLKQNNTERKPRKATSEEVKFERFVKRRVKGVLSQDFINMISAEHYISLVRVIIDIFAKYTYDDNVEDIFETEYKIETMTGFLIRVLSIDISESEEYNLLADKVVTWGLTTILENHNLIKYRYKGVDDYRLNQLNTYLLKILEEKYYVRKELNSLLKKVFDENLNIDYRKINNYDFEKAVAYVDSLYGYKNIEKLEEFIKKRYEEGTIISLEDNLFKVEVSVDNISECFKPDIVLLKEIFAYIKNECVVVKTIIIKINNKMRIFDGSNYAQVIEYKVTVNYKKYKRTIYYVNGNKHEDAYKIINF